MTQNTKDKLPSGIVAVLGFMFAVLAALLVYWGLAVTGTVSFI